MKKGGDLSEVGSFRGVAEQGNGPSPTVSSTQAHHLIWLTLPCITDTIHLDRLASVRQHLFSARADWRNQHNELDQA